jgi:hypothetical protein
MSRFKRRPLPAPVIPTIALVLAAGGVAAAALPGGKKRGTRSGFGRAGRDVLDQPALSREEHVVRRLAVVLALALVAAVALVPPYAHAARPSERAVPALSRSPAAPNWGFKRVSVKHPRSSVRVSSDPYSDPVGQHRTEVEPDTFSAAGRWVGAFIVGKAIVGGGSNIGWVTSTNGGRRFARGFLPGITENAGGHYDRVADPSVAYDAAHRVWLISSLAVKDPVGGVAIRRDILVSRAHARRRRHHRRRSNHWHRLRWERPVTVAATQGNSQFDKNWTVCDNHRSSPFFGHCYTEFDDFAQADRIKMSTSTDGGLTWSAPINTADNWFGLGGQPVVQPDGTVIVPIQNLVLSGLQAFRSTDGGQNWTAVVQVTPTTFHRAGGGLRSGPGPSADVDRSGKVYAAWADCRFRAGCTSNDIVISTTTDGIIWSPVARIPIDAVDSGADHFLPGLAVAPRSSGAHARLALTYYSYPNADCTVVTCELNVGFISSRNGGASWSAPAHLAGPMRLDWLANTTQGRMVGDYISTSFIRGRALPLFAQAGPPRGGRFDEAMATVRGGRR